MQKITVPYGEKGSWVVEPYEITEKEARFENMRMTFHGEGYRTPEPGIFTILCHNGRVIMSDTRAEMRDHSYFIHRAKGNVLINGLGLGVVVHNLLLKDEVKHMQMHLLTILVKASNSMPSGMTYGRVSRAIIFRPCPLYIAVMAGG